MAIGKFFSVERIGYTRVSDAFIDIYADMINNGFYSVNGSHLEKATEPNAGELVALKCTITSLATPAQALAVGDRLHFDPASALFSPPLFAGQKRASMFVYVTAKSGTAATGTVTVVGDVHSDFDSNLTAGYDLSEVSAQIQLNSPIAVDLYKEDVATKKASTTKVCTVEIEKFSNPIFSPTSLNIYCSSPVSLLIFKK